MLIAMNAEIARSSRPAPASSLFTARPCFYALHGAYSFYTTQTSRQWSCVANPRCKSCINRPSCINGLEIDTCSEGGDGSRAAPQLLLALSKVSAATAAGALARTRHGRGRILRRLPAPTVPESPPRLLPLPCQLLRGRVYGTLLYQCDTLPYCQCNTLPYQLLRGTVYDTLPFHCNTLLYQCNTPVSAPARHAHIRSPISSSANKCISSFSYTLMLDPRSAPLHMGEGRRGMSSSLILQHSKCSSSSLEAAQLPT